MQPQDQSNPLLTRPEYRPDIDGLRAIAVGYVVLYHAFPKSITGGFIGVDLFFVISGFLITTLILKGLASGEFTFSQFYIRRIKRIFPALLLVLVVCYVFGWFVLYADEYQQLGKHIAAGAGFISNFILWSESGYFDVAASAKPLLHLWSLGIEEQFYILWPLLLCLIWKRTWSLLSVIGVLLLLSFWLNVSTIESDSIATFYSPITRFWELLVGSLLACYMLDRPHGILEGKSAPVGVPFASLQHPKLATALSILGAILLIYGAWRINTTMPFPGKWALLPVLGAVFMIAAGPHSWVNQKILSHRLLVGLGLISFPLYLWHWPILSFAKIVQGDDLGIETTLLAIAAALGLAWMTYRLIEKPIRFGAHSTLKATVLILLMVLMGLIGYITQVREGLPFRSAVQAVQMQASDLVFKIENMSGWLCDQLKYDYHQCYYTGDKPSVAVVGDSHAPRIYSGLREYYASQGKGVAIYGGGPGCPPLFNVVSKDDHTQDHRNCLMRMTDALRTIRDEQSIKEVVLVSRGILYVTSTGFGNHDDQFGKWVLHFDGEPQGQRTNLEVYSLGLIKTIDELLKAGKKVSYLHDVPELGFDIKSCMSARHFRTASKERNPCAITRAQYEARTQEFKQQMNQLLATRPQVRVVDLSEALCDKQYCYGAKDGVLFYTDDDHLSHRGSSYVVRRLWNQFQ
jgi:peptidoglycan/LPS O-acetylase OafA/YrhL